MCLFSLCEVMGIVHYKRVKLVLCSVARLARPLFCLYPNLPQARIISFPHLQAMK